MKRLYKVFLEDPTSTSPISECTVVAGNAEHAVESAKLAFPGKALDSVSSMPHKNLIIAGESAGESAAENDYADMRRFQALYIRAYNERCQFKNLLREALPCIRSIGTIELLERIVAELNKKSSMDEVSNADPENKEKRRRIQC